MTELAQASEVGSLETLLLKHPRDAFRSDAAIERQWRELNYVARPDLGAAIDEFDRLVEWFVGLGVDTHFLPADETTGLDSMYVRDAAVAGPRGVILCSMGKSARRAEPAAQGRFYRDSGIPILGEVVGEGLLEGGDVIWLDERTLVVGEGYRTNAEGIRQLERLLAEDLDELFVAQLPHYRGPGDVFHLMSIWSPIDRDLALVYSPLMPVALRELLLARGLELVEVPEEEFDSMGCNVLAVAPRHCMTVAGNPETRRRLERAGAEVHEIEAGEISLKGCGGPTCLTRPLRRRP